MRYALPMEIPTHRKLVEEYCFNACTQLSIAFHHCINIEVAGICWVCEQADCKYEDQSVLIAHDITLRKLKEEKHE